jgi:hypothetical protein
VQLQLADAAALGALRGFGAQGELVASFIFVPPHMHLYNAAAVGRSSSPAAAAQQPTHLEGGQRLQLAAFLAEAVQLAAHPYLWSQVVRAADAHPSEILLEV